MRRRGPSGVDEGPRPPPHLLGRRWTSRILARGCLVMMALVAGSACYTGRVVPVSSPAVAPGSDVVVRLTAPGAVRLAEASGRTDRVLQGSVQEDPGESLMLAVRSRAPGRSIGSEALRELLVIPVMDVEELQVRDFSGTRTAVLAVGAVGAAVALAVFAFGWADGASGRGEDPPPGGVPFRARLRFGVP